MPSHETRLLSKHPISPPVTNTITGLPSVSNTQGFNFFYYVVLIDWSVHPVGLEVRTIIPLPERFCTIENIFSQGHLAAQKIGLFICAATSCGVQIEVILLPETRISVSWRGRRNNHYTDRSQMCSMMETGYLLVLKIIIYNLYNLSPMINN